MIDLNWDKSNDLIPAIIQNPLTMQVLMLGYMDKTALELTLQTKKVTFYSRSQQRYWTKGETSGNYLNFIELHIDCDQDTILIYAIPEGPTCHLNTTSCFNTDQQDFITQLEKIIDNRKTIKPENSYVAGLFNQGVKRIAQKVGEEAVELSIAAVDGDICELKEEFADLLFHLLVLLRYFEISWSEMLNILNNRNMNR